MRKLLIFAASFAAAALSGCAGAETESVTSERLLVGTFGDYLYRVTFDNGELYVTDSIEARSPAYLAKDGDLLYSVSECDPESGVYSFRDYAITGYSDQVGGSPCFILRLENTDKVVTAEYAGGSLSVFSTDSDGALSARTQHFVYSDSHVHQARTIPADICAAAGIEGEWLLATDLGADTIRVYSVDPASAEPLTEHPELSIPCPDGCGPRHMEFNESSSMLYCITELSDELLTWRIGSSEGRPLLTPCQRLKANDADAGGSADIHLSPDGRFLYTSHRLLNDGIALFSVGADGSVEKTGYFSTEPHPRNFLISEDGRWLYVASRDSSCIQLFAVSQDDGSLTLQPQVLRLAGGKPVCIIHE